MRHTKVLWPYFLQIPPILARTGRNDVLQKAEFYFDGTKQNPVFSLVAVRRTMHVGSNVNLAIDPKEFISDVPLSGTCECRINASRYFSRSKLNKAEE